MCACAWRHTNIFLISVLFHVLTFHISLFMKIRFASFQVSHLCNHTSTNNPLVFLFSFQLISYQIPPKKKHNPLFLLYMKACGVPKGQAPFYFLFNTKSFKKKGCMSPQASLNTLHSYIYILYYINYIFFGSTSFTPKFPATRISSHHLRTCKYSQDHLTPVYDPWKGHLEGVPQPQPQTLR